MLVWRFFVVEGTVLIAEEINVFEFLLLPWV
jgi:hypothetical protein